MHNLFFVTQNLSGREISRFSVALFLAAMLALLAGCGSGGAGGSPADAAAAAAVAEGATPPTPTTFSIQLLASSPQIDSSGVNTVDLTAVVLSATRQVITNKSVTFSSASDSSAFINNISANGVSDSNGLVTAKLNLGNDKSNRTITVSATADSTTETNNIDVTGTTISVSGNSSLSNGDTTKLTFSLKDSAGTALPGVKLNVTSKTGNDIVLDPSTGITDKSGEITADVTASQPGNDTITATAAGAVAELDLTISSASFSITDPPKPATKETPPTEILLDTDTAVSVNWKEGGNPVVGSVVSFSSSRGTFTGSGAITDAGGNVTATVKSDTAGPAILSASGLTGTPAATREVIFVATSATNVTVQAVPGTVQVTTGSDSQTSNSSTISAVVRDAKNNLVKNAGVSFTITSDPSGGRLTSSTGITDVSGKASVTYVAGGTSSAQNGVTISATVNTVRGASIAPAVVTGSATLTVSGQSLLVRLGTDNKVGGTAPVNTKTYAALVTDAAGNPVVGSTVRFNLRPGRYIKGNWINTVIAWSQNITSPYCQNEDINFNGILDPGEDTINSSVPPSGKLEPGLVASVNASGVTDDAGMAIATVTYAKEYSKWAEVTLEARTGVVGNDPPTSTTFWLWGLAADYLDLTVTPPGDPSPFGQSTTCTDTQ